MGARWLGLAPLLVALAIACALPWRPERVLPEVEGRIGESSPAADAQLMLDVMNRDTPTLHARQQVDVAADGQFRFEPIFLEVAGREFGKHYRIYLHLRSGGTDRVIWRAVLSRLEATGPIPLDCDLTRPIALGEVCRVRDPLRQPWLLADGKHHFERLCARCHGADGRGNAASRAADDGTGDRTPPDLTRIAARHDGRFDPDRVAAWIDGRTLSLSHSRGGMPVWGERLSSEFERYAEGDELIGATLDPIVAYLESLQQVD